MSIAGVQWKSQGLLSARGVECQNACPREISIFHRVKSKISKYCDVEDIANIISYTFRRGRYVYQTFIEEVPVPIGSTTFPAIGY